MPDWDNRLCDLFKLLAFCIENNWKELPITREGLDEIIDYVVQANALHALPGSVRC